MASEGAAVLDRPADQRRAAWARAAKRRRARAKACEAVASVVYDGDVLDFLIDSGWLRGWDAGDRKAVGLAISRLLQDTATRHA
jgi:hypothetical protein